MEWGDGLRQEFPPEPQAPVARLASIERNHVRVSKPLGSVGSEVRAPAVEDSYAVRTIKVLVGCGGALIAGMFLLVFLLMILGTDQATPEYVPMTPQPTAANKPGA